MAALESIPYSFFSSKVVIYFFIGRMNPPHAGHEAALRQMMERASAERSIPLILVGSGPNQGERTLNDPLTFSTKRRVLQYRLSGSLCEIREKTDPVRDVMEWTHEVMRNVGDVRSVEFKLVTGDKDGNATKLDWIHKSLVKQMAPTGIPCKSDSIAIRAQKSAGVEMSATKVRQDALSAFVSGDGSFAKYSGYYGPHTANVYGEITELAPAMGQAAVMHYIATGELAKKSKSKSKKKKNQAENYENF
jgi:nicotinamide mononucleotide adenylyltransferase